MTAALLAECVHSNESHMFTNVQQTHVLSSNKSFAIMKSIGCVADKIMYFYTNYTFYMYMHIGNSSGFAPLQNQG